MSGYDAALKIVEDAIASRIFPAAAIEVGDSRGPGWSDGLGRLSFAADARPASIDTPFDLASLTKPMATATLAMELVQAGALRLDEPVRSFFDDWRGADREAVTVRDLLEHASGLPARLVDAPPGTRREFEHDIGVIALEYPPRSASIYSDLGFILLGFLIADRGRRPLAGQFDRFASRLRLGGDLLAFEVPPAQRELTARTMPMDEDARRGRVLAGEVHDNYAAALGGAAGHAGLFGTAPAVGAFARAVLQTIAGDPALAQPATFREFIRRTAIPGSSRALGWDTMLPTSSCGTLLSSTAIGHTGFTGTSLWIDWERDLYIVLLTNRVHPTRDNERIRALRPRFHDAVVQSLITNH